MSGQGTTQSTTLGTLTEIVNTFSKDSVGAFRGTRSIQNASIRATLATYQQLELAAERIAETMRALGRGPVLLQAGESVADLGEYLAFLSRAEKLAERLKKEIAEAEGLFPEEQRVPAGADVAPATLVGAVFQAALSIGGLLFRKDVTEVHTAVTIDDSVLVNMVREKLSRGSSVEVLHPAEVALLPISDNGRLSTLLAELDEYAQRLRTLLALVNARLARKNEEPEDPARRPFVKAQPRIDAAVKVFEAFWTALGAQAGKLLRSDAVLTKLGERGTILALRILAGGATARTEAGFVDEETELYGGVLVSYALISTKGRLLAWRTVERYGQFETADRTVDLEAEIEAVREVILRRET
jgi:hypothetical protein